MQNDRFLGMLGLARRAGRTVCGVPLICDALRTARPGKTPVLVLEAADTSQNTHKRINDRCAYYHVEAVRLTVDSAALAHAVGHSGLLAAVGITDPQMAAALRALLDPPPPTA